MPIVDSRRWARMPSGTPTSTKQIEANAATHRRMNSVLMSLSLRRAMLRDLCNFILDSPLKK